MLSADHLHRLAWIGAQRGVGAVAGLFLIGLGDAEKHSDRSHRDLLPEIGDEVETAGTDERIENASAKLSDLVFESEHLLRREHSGEQASMDIV